MVVYQEDMKNMYGRLFKDINNKELLVDRKDNTNNVKEVFPHSLCEYNGGEVLQTYRDNYKLNSDHRLDIYKYNTLYKYFYKYNKYINI